MTNNLMKLKFY